MTYHHYCYKLWLRRKFWHLFDSLHFVFDRRIVTRCFNGTEQWIVSRWRNSRCQRKQVIGVFRNQTLLSENWEQKWPRSHLFIIRLKCEQFDFSSFQRLPGCIWFLFEQLWATWSAQDAGGVWQLVCTFISVQPLIHTTGRISSPPTLFRVELVVICALTVGKLQLTHTGPAAALQTQSGNESASLMFPSIPLSTYLWPFGFKI